MKFYKSDRLLFLNTNFHPLTITKDHEEDILDSSP